VFVNVTVNKKMQTIKADLVVKNARICTENGIVFGGMAIKNGKIIAIGGDNELASGKKELDINKKLIIPGLVDLHVHFREPGGTQKEDFFTGTKAAAAGGVTTVFDEPNNIPITNSLEALEAKLALVKNKAVVDYAFNVSLNSNNLHQILLFRKFGIKSFAVFDEIVDTPTGLTHCGILRDALEQVKQVDGIAFFNCRESEIIDRETARLKRVGKNTLKDYNQSYPAIAEVLSAAKQLLIADEIGVKCHFREVSTLECVNIFKQLKVKTDTCIEARPDHLFLTQENSEHLGPLAQQWTPIRSEKQSKALWQAIDEKIINVIASDHATHTFEEKMAGNENIWEAPPGIPAIESMLPLLLNRINEGKLSVEQMVELTALNPAKFIGLYPKKGVLKIGSDADFVVVDLEREALIKGKDYQSKAKWTPFEDWKIKGVPIMTFLRGEKIYEEGRVCASPGYGQYLEF
jgi:allantoinase